MIAVLLKSENIILTMVSTEVLLLWLHKVVQDRYIAFAWITLGYCTDDPKMVKVRNNQVPFVDSGSLPLSECPRISFL